MVRFRSLAALLGAAALLVTACGSSGKSSSPTTSSSGAGSSTTVGGLKASAPGISTTSIKLGLITSLTGDASSEYLDLPKAAQARANVANASGGVDGRQLQIVTCDDTSAPTGNAECAQKLVSEGVFGIIAESPFVFGGYKYMQQQGIPVTGGAYDGPEWGQQPNTNMFSTTGPADPHQPQYTQPAQFMKQQGVTSVAAFGYGESPSSSAAAKGFAFSSKYVGLTVGYLNSTLPFGTVDTAPLALTMKQSGVNGASMEMDENTNFAILTAAKQAGVDMKVAISATGYGQSLLNDPSAVQDGQGTYFPPTAAPVELKTPATLAMQAAFAKYAGFTGVPDFDWYEGWLGTDLMIKGLQVAGNNPTRNAFITNLRQVTNYTGGGLLPAPVSYSLSAFGQAPQTLCGWYTILQGNQFMVINGGKPVCGTLIPNSNQL
jgi:branched-chain amino acid transport system substrate-binding protein